MNNKIKMSELQRRAMFLPGSFSDQDSSVEVVFSSETPVLTYNSEIGYFNEVLSHETGCVRLQRLKDGASVLDNHNKYGSIKGILGVTDDARVEKQQGIARIRLSTKEDNIGFVKDVKDGIVKNVSVGYKVYRYQDISTPDSDTRTLKAIDWEPYEISFVQVPADPRAQVRNDNEKNECEIISEGEKVNKRNEGENQTAAQVATTTEAEPANSQAQAPAAQQAEATPAQEPANAEVIAEQEKQRNIEIMESCQAHGLGSDFARSLIAGKQSIGEVRKLIINKIAEEKSSMQPQNAHVTLSVDEKDKKRSAAELSLMSKIGLSVELKDEARFYRNLSLIELARELDPSVRKLDKREVAARAMMSTSDFPILFSNVAKKSLAKGYENAPKTFQRFVNQVSMSDFKEISKVSFGTAPDLEAIAEGGEYKFGTMTEKGEKYKLSKYGKKIRLTEEMFINDDLQALSRLPALFGNASSRLESKIVYGILTGNPVMADSKNLFHADHKNLGTSGAPSETTLDEMFTLMGSQIGLDKEKLNLMPKFLICGHANRLAAQKLLASVVASKTGDVNVFQNALELIVDANIEGKSWFGSIDPAVGETIDVGYLEGMNGPEVKSITDEENDCIILKCKHIFVAKAVDYRGLFKNPYA